MKNTIEVSNPPLFVIVSAPGGNLWLNAHRILSMREDGKTTHVEMDNGETFHIAERAAEIAKSVQRPSVTIVANPPAKRSRA
jgi:uncharacterized protein YlzI (FlbEa/FlbD family)